MKNSSQKTSNFLVIIPCGFKKETSPRPAGKLYIGGYFRTNLKWALSVATSDRILILSAKHGLLNLNEIIEPYNLKMGMKGCVSEEFVKKQALNRGIIDSKIYAIGGKNYLDILKAIFPLIKCPVEGKALGISNSILLKNLGKLP